mgnify:CR=1 FL=1
MTDTKLPPMPPSDQGAFERNHFDNYYRRSAREFWKDAEIIRIKDEPMEKCHHEFKVTPTGAQCRRCNFGLMGQIEVREGKLFINNEPIVFDAL